MNAKERYLSVLDDDKRKKLDHVPIFVQYIPPEFTLLDQNKFQNMSLFFHSICSRFTDAYFIDFIVIGFGDISQVIPFGYKEETFNRVKNLLNTLKENRHFIIRPSTVIYEGIPHENVDFL